MTTSDHDAAAQEAISVTTFPLMEARRTHLSLATFVNVDKRLALYSYHKTLPSRE